MLTLRDIERFKQQAKTEEQKLEPVVHKTPPPKTSERSADDKFKLEEPDFNNRQQALARARGFASISNNANLFDLLHKDAFADAPRVWIIGGGPSAKSFDFNMLEGEIVIAVNRSYQLPQSTMVVFMDKQFIRWILDKKMPENPELAYRQWRDFAGPKIAVVPPGAAVCQADDDPYCIVPSVPREMDAGVPEPWNGLKRCNNSGLAALKLAWGLGAKDIRLIGFDLKNGSAGHQEWHHQGYPKVGTTEPYSMFVERFEECVTQLNASGVSVTNYSPDSSLLCFPRKPLPQLVQRNPLPVVVCFYTLNTPYEREAKEMAASFRSFGFQVVLEGTPSRSTWIENVYYKPQFIMSMMETFSDRTIIWADSDSRMRRYPKELMELLESGKDFNIATSFCDWKKLGNDKMIRARGTERQALSSAFVVINPTNTSYNIISKWNEKCQSILAQFHAGKLSKPPVDDLVLEDIYYRNKTYLKKWVKLPTNYAQIFDLQKDAGVPVVEQLQASRRNKSIIDRMKEAGEVAQTDDDFLVLKEAALYNRLWKSGEYTDSKTAKVFHKVWGDFLTPEESVLEVGAGSGSTLRVLRDGGVKKVRGYDLTLAGVVKHNPDVIELMSDGPSWILPYGDASFDHILSIDFLEHVPTRKLEQTIQEMYRVCRGRMTHIIATFHDTYGKDVVHKTVNNIQWWKEMFEGFVPKGMKYDLVIVDRRDFLEKYLRGEKK